MAIQSPPSIKAAFNLPFKEAETFFKGKVNVPTQRWDDLWHEQHARGFMVAGAVNADLISDFRSAVDKAISGKSTLADFRKNFDTIVAKHGWSYNGTRNWRSRVIYETNVRQAYMAGRWKQMTDPDVVKMRPYLQYRHGDSVHPRPWHLAWNGMILRYDDPWWSTHYPQNGWGCKCTVVSLGPRDVADERKGKVEADIPPNPPGDTEGVDPGFGHNIGMAFKDLLEDISRPLMKRTPGDIASMFIDQMKKLLGISIVKGGTIEDIATLEISSSALNESASSTGDIIPTPEQ